MAEVEGEVMDHLEELGDLRERLIALVEEDARAFKPLAAAYRMPKGTPEELAAKQDALQRALVGATEVPLDIMRTVARVVDHARLSGAPWQPNGQVGRGGFGCIRPGGGRWRKLERVYQRGFDGRPRQGRSVFAEEAAAIASTTRERCDELFDFVVKEVS